MSVGHAEYLGGMSRSRILSVRLFRPSLPSFPDMSGPNDANPGVFPVFRANTGTGAQRSRAAPPLSTNDCSSGNAPTRDSDRNETGIETGTAGSAADGPGILQRSTEATASRQARMRSRKTARRHDGEKRYSCLNLGISFRSAQLSESPPQSQNDSAGAERRTSARLARTATGEKGGSFTPLELAVSDALTTVNALVRLHIPHSVRTQQSATGSSMSTCPGS